MADNILPYFDNEYRWIEDFMQILAGESPEDFSALQKYHQNLLAMGDIFSRQSPVSRPHRIGNNRYTVESLVDMMRGYDIVDSSFFLPTEAVIGKDTLVCKIHLLLMFRVVGAGKLRMTAEQKLFLDKALMNNFFSLMLDDLYLSLLLTPELSEAIVNAVAEDLFTIWEKRFTEQQQEFVTSHCKIFIDLWQARHKLQPVFATLLGVSEMSAIAQEVDPIWFNFLESSRFDKMASFALSEFLFNLSYEELTELQNVMKQDNVKMASEKYIKKTLGIKDHFATFYDQDPKQHYGSYLRRRKNILARQSHRLPGPTMTIEQLLLLYIKEEELNTQRRQSGESL